MPRVTITVPDSTPQPYRFQLDRRKVTLGRGSDNDIAINCASVSVKHAEMVRIDGGYELRDLGSTNGTKENGERRITVPLYSGISVLLGDVTFDFVLSDEELAALRHEAPSASAPTQPVKPEEPSLAGASASSGKAGAMMLVLFLVLAGGAFVAGLEIRHQKETGHSLFEKAPKKAKPTDETPAATPETPAPTLAPAPAPDAPPPPTEPGK